MHATLLQAVALAEHRRAADPSPANIAFEGQARALLHEFEVREGIRPDPTKVGMTPQRRADVEKYRAAALKAAAKAASKPATPAESATPPTPQS